jgi:hypothetical protein
VLPPDADAAIAATGAAAARALRERLVQRLTVALETGGPAGAIDVCANEALSLTDSIARAGGGGVRIRRISDRVRNPANAPDDGDREALAEFKAELRSGRALPERLVLAAGPDSVRYYEPLRVAPLCLQCHGPVDALDAQVREVLSARYPDDSAVGYSEGDLRGLIRVTIPAPRQPSR